jgi:hypothetical protein
MRGIRGSVPLPLIYCDFLFVYIYIRRMHCHTLPRTLPHTASHCRTLPHALAYTATHTATYCPTAAHCRTLPHCRTAAHYRTAAHALLHCRTAAQPDTATRTVIRYQAHSRILLQERAGHNIWIVLHMDIFCERRGVLGGSLTSTACRIWYIKERQVAGRRRQATAYGYNIVSDVVQEGAVWRLQPVYDIIRSDGLQEKGRPQHMDIILWATWCRRGHQSVVYSPYMIQHGAKSGWTLPHRWTAAYYHEHCQTAAHCRTHCHTLPCALQHIHCCVHCRALLHALPHTAAHYRTDRQPHTLCRAHFRTAAHCRTHCHTLPRVLPHTAACTTAQCRAHCRTLPQATALTESCTLPHALPDSQTAFNLLKSPEIP